MSTADVRMKGFGKRASVEEVVALIEARVRPLAPERIPFRTCAGRVLAEDIVAPRDVPPHPRAAMDGYAVRAADVPGTLTIAGEVTAAGRFEGRVGPSQAVRIMTGAPVPAGADQVVMVEETSADGGRVTVRAPAKPGQHVMETGADLRAGQAVLGRGRRLRPADIAMLASVGALEVAVHRRPRVRIVPTGNELVPPGTRPEGSQVVESNASMLEALAVRDGGEPTIHPIVPDDPALLRRAIGGELESAEVVVVTGGSSVGREDYPPVVLREIGELPIHGVDVRPASPTGVGFIGETVVILAPGYPVASYVAWDLFVRPAVQRLAGAPVALPYPTTAATLGREHHKPRSRLEVLRVTLHEGPEGGRIATVLPGGAGLLSTLTRADGFVLFPAGADQFSEGAPVEVHLYDETGR